MKKQILWTKLCAILILTVFVISIGMNVYLGISLARMQQKEERRIQEEEALSKMYLNQNTAFCLPQYGIYLPYSELGNGDSERDLYRAIQYYNYSTNSSLSLDDIYQYLSSPMDHKALKNYEDYPEIKAFVEFELEMRYADYYLPESKRKTMLLTYFSMFSEIQKEHPEFAEYSSLAAPFKLVDEIMHKIADSSYEMDLEITDERNYGYITPEILELGHGNTY